MASYVEISGIAPLKLKQPPTQLWFAQPWNTQQQFGTPTSKRTSRPLNKFNDEQHVMYLTTTLPEHQGASQIWSTNSSGKVLRPEENLIDWQCCIRSSMDWSISSQKTTFNKATDVQEGNTVSTKKESAMRYTTIPSSQEPSGTGTCYHLGHRQHQHWRDSRQTLQFAAQCLATNLPVCLCT